MHDSSKKHPYLPHPFPIKRVARAQDGHQGGFTSLQETMRPPKEDPSQEDVYCTYPEWWWAQRPPFGKSPKADEVTFSTSYWPYGRRMSAISSIDDKGEFYDLDDRRIRNHTFVKQHLRDQSPFQSFSSRSHSAAALMGSTTEHQNYDKSLGRTAASHAGASFHASNKLAASTASATAGKRTLTMWDHQAEKLESSLRRSPSAPSTMRSLDATAGSSLYDPKQSLRDLGLGSRTHAEFRLPQDPVRANTPWK